MKILPIQNISLFLLQIIDWKSGTFNTFVFRVSVLVAVCGLQAWLMMNFITFQLKKRREDAANSANIAPSKSKKTQQEKAKARKEKPKKEAKEDEEENELPEVDQNTKQSLRQRK